MDYDRNPMFDVHVADHPNTTRLAGLTVQDLPAHSPEMTPEAVLLRLDREWDNELATRGAEGASLLRTVVRCHRWDVARIVLLLTLSGVAWMVSPAIFIRNLVAYSSVSAVHVASISLLFFFLIRFLF